MKLNLRASISPLFTSKNSKTLTLTAYLENFQSPKRNIGIFTGRKRSISDAVSIIPKLHFSTGVVSSNKCHAGFEYIFNSSPEKRISHPSLTHKVWKLSMQFSSYGVRGTQNLKRSLHSSSDEEDIFSELDSPLSEGGVTHTKLVTEQPNSSLSADLSGRAAFQMLLHGTNKPKTNHNGVSRAKIDAENAPKYKSSRSITIEKVHSTISLDQLREALSIFGEILNASMRAGPYGFNNCYVEFKTMESKERAVEVQAISVRNVHLQIRSMHVQENITIRISNVSADTAEPAVHLICMSCGPMEGLLRTKEGFVDVSFNVSDSLAKQGILKKLNEVFINNCQWSAQLLPTVTTSTDMSSTSDTQLRDGLQFRDLLTNITKEIHMRRIFLEDLVELHNNVVHLQDRPVC